MPSRTPGRLSRLLPLLAVLAGGAAPSPATAQEVVREVQVPLDPDRGVVEVDAELRRQLGLFPDVDGFVSARLFEATGGTNVLELTLREDGRLVRERRTLGQAELAELRDRIAAGMEARGMARAVSGEGRGGLVLAETLLGLGFYGWAVPAVLDIDSDRGGLAAYLLTAGASFYVPYRITRGIPVTDAHRDAAVWGGTRGILYGLLLGDALTLGDDDEPFNPDDPDDEDARVIVGLGMAASIAGSVLGYQAVDPARHDRGDVALWSTAGDFALAYGFGAALALGLYEDELECHGDVCVADDFGSTLAGHLTTVGIGLGGLYAGRRWAEARDYGVGDARALTSFGLLGAQALLPLGWDVFEGSEDGERGFAATLVAGSVAGLWWGDRTLRSRSLSPGDGLLVQAGHLAGGALAGGLTYLLDDGNSDDLLYLTTTAAGSVLGSLATFRAVSGERRAGERGADAADAGRRAARPGPSVEVSATGLWAPLLARGSTGRVRLPVVTIRH